MSTKGWHLTLCGEMQFVMFTKHLKDLSIEQLIKVLTDMGVTGADLAVRPGYPVNPDNMITVLPRVAQQFRENGLDIPLVTAPVDLTSPASPKAQEFYEACGKAGVAHLKIGYWKWNPERPFWDQIAEIREWLEKLQIWSVQYGVKTVVHNHSGTTLGMNSSQMMHLVLGFDPSHIGVFADLGHLAVCGEPISMALEMVSDFLACVACKDLLRTSLPKSQGWWERGAPSKTFTVPLGRGFADYNAALATLRKIRFSGTMSLHSEYEESVEDVIAMTKMDFNYINKILSELD